MRLAWVVSSILALCLAVTSAFGKNGAPSRLFPYYEEDVGVTLLGQVVALGSREEIVNSGTHYRFLLATGIADSDLTDGRLAVIVLYCCHAKTAESQAIWAFVPATLALEREDLVEVRMGRVPGKDGDPGVVNAVTALRQKAADAAGGPCRWTPEDPNLWMRVVYCAGMEQQGWQQRGGMRKLWFRSPQAESPPPEAQAAPITPSAAGSVGAAPPAPGTAPCISLSVHPDLARAVSGAMAGLSPPVDVRLQGAAGSETCSRRLELQYRSAVDNSSQQRNRDGAAIMGFTGLLVGAITPWSCPTTHILTGSLRDSTGADLGSFEATKVQKRVGTMLVCGEVEHPSDATLTELVQNLMQQVQSSEARVAAPAQ